MVKLTFLVKTKPVERKEIITSIINSNKIDSLIDGIKRKIENNEQIFLDITHHWRRRR